MVEYKEMGDREIQIGRDPEPLGMWDRVEFVLGERVSIKCSECGREHTDLDLLPWKGTGTVIADNYTGFYTCVSCDADIPEEMTQGLKFLVWLDTLFADDERSYTSMAFYHRELRKLKERLLTLSSPTPLPDNESTDLVEIVPDRVQINQVLTQTDYENMKLASQSWRDTLLLMTLRATGFRPSEVSGLQGRHFGSTQEYYYFLVRRKKKRDPNQPLEQFYIHPVLGQAIAAHIKGNNITPAKSIFGVLPRQMRNITNAAGERGIGRGVMPKEFRGLYVRTVAGIAPHVVGFTPQHMQIAQIMVGHESVRTTWDWYFQLTEEQKIKIQENIPV